MASTFHQVLTLIALWSISWISQAEPRQLLDEVRSVSRTRQHDDWVSSQGRVYKDSAEKEKRQKIFDKNLDYIEKFNSQTNRSFKLKANKFADLTNQEFHETKTGGFAMVNLTRSLTSATMSFPSEYRTQDYGYDYSTPSSSSSSSSSSVPSSVDWRDSNVVTPIREQGQCASCWAFATVATIESLIYMKTGKTLRLSEQQLIDCVTNGPNTHGCKGGNPDEALTYITQNKGIAASSDYPYRAKNGTCNSNAAARVSASIAGYVDVPEGDEEALRFAVSKQPVTAFVDSRGENFQFYGGGVYDADCGTKLDHVVAIVGYGETEDGVAYWLIKNSWGTGWGEDGYMRLLRNSGSAQGHCGIATYASYPTL